MIAINLQDMQTEVLNHGFDGVLYGNRVIGYLNDAYHFVCRRVPYYINDATQAIQTNPTTAILPLPPDWAKTRSFVDTDRHRELEAVPIHDLDEAPVSQGRPRAYAQVGQNLYLYPTPDGAYNLLLRYWLLPPLLVQLTDAPTLPPDYHPMLCEYAIARCFWGEDDASMGQQWDQQFAQSLSDFAGDQRYPDANMSTRIRSMWGEGETGWNLRWGPR